MKNLKVLIFVLFAGCVREDGSLITQLELNNENILFYEYNQPGYRIDGEPSSTCTIKRDGSVLFQKGEESYEGEISHQEIDEIIKLTKEISKSEISTKRLGGCATDLDIRRTKVFVLKNSSVVLNDTQKRDQVGCVSINSSGANTDKLYEIINNHCSGPIRCP